MTEVVEEEKPTVVESPKTVPEPEAPSIELQIKVSNGKRSC